VICRGQIAPPRLENGRIAGIIIVTMAPAFTSLADALSNQLTAIGGNL
jgi:Flp pilus assembly pilin Flp